ISGQFPRVYFTGPEERMKIRSIEQWGDIAWVSMGHAFEGAAHLQYNATDAPDLRKVTDMAAMFKDASQFDGDLSAWDVSGVLYMEEMFANAVSFRGEGLSRWDVGRVLNMREMFSGAVSFNEDISGWNVSSVN